MRRELFLKTELDLLIVRKVRTYIKNCTAQTAQAEEWAQCRSSRDGCTFRQVLVQSGASPLSPFMFKHTILFVFPVHTYMTHFVIQDAEA